MTWLAAVEPIKIGGVRMSRRLLLPTVAFALALASLTAVAIAYLDDSAEPYGRLPPRPDVPLHAAAVSSGIRLELTRAAFSASATYIELTATVVDGTSGVRLLRIPAAALTARSLSIVGDGAAVPAGQPSVVRFSAPVMGRAMVIEATAVEIIIQEGTRDVRGGLWTLELDAPGDLAARLRSEVLVGGPADDAGIRVAPEGILRTTTETLVTLRIDSDVPVSQLGQPVLISGGRLLQGGLVGEAEDGRLITFAFPPTRFGDPATLKVGPFVSRGAASTGSVGIDLGAILVRHGMDGAHNQSAPILDFDATSAAGAELAPARIQFDGLCQSSRRPGMKCLKVEIAGIWEPPSTTLTVSDAAGRTVPSTITETGYTKDPTGAIGGGSTVIRLYYNSLDELRTQVEIVVIGHPSETIRGEWTMSLEPLRAE
jgi:hypothetical protein